MDPNAGPKYLVFSTQVFGCSYLELMQVIDYKTRIFHFRGKLVPKTKLMYVIVISLLDMEIHPNTHNKEKKIILILSCPILV